MRLLVALSVLLLVACASSTPPPPRDVEWPAYANDGGTHWSPLRDITRENVRTLQQAWTFHTGEAKFETEAEKKSAFEATPIFVDGTLYVVTPFDAVIAVDPATGVERWRFDPKLSRDGDYSEVTSRGVAYWRDGGGACGRRVFVATIDARLFAIDATDGRLCRDFGAEGVVDLSNGIPNRRPGDYQVTSPAAVLGDVVVVGSSIGDNGAAELERGVVRAYDVRSGTLRWSWDPLPPNSDTRRTGAANAWAPITADPASGLVFVPTSSPSPDYYGGLRRGSDDFANSVVAIEAATGKVVWHYQVVHHDLWDYDVASQPVLVTVGTTPAVAVGTKMGMVFLLDRRTGQPIFPVEERAVPKSDIEGEDASAMQPFPTKPAPLVPMSLSPDDAWGPTDEDRAACREKIAALRSTGIYTPPSLQGTVVRPSNVGGMHWGGMSYDADRHILVAPVNRLAAMVRLIPRDQLANARNTGERITGEFNRMSGTPFGMYREFLLSPRGIPCTAPPWGSLVAVNTDTGEKLWESGFGGYKGNEQFASPNLGGSLVVNGLVFVAATMDEVFRAFDIETGREVWRATLPASAQATPMTYRYRGKQYVVIAAGGHGKLHTKRGDAVVAFAVK